MPPSQHTAAQSSLEPSAGIQHALRLRYKLAASTLTTLMTIPKSPVRQEVLKTACKATELTGCTFKPAEKAFFRHVNDHTPIPYPIVEGISLAWHKVFLLTQLDLSHRPWPNRLTALARKELYQERGQLYKVLKVTLRCLIDILGDRGDGRGLSVALDVLRSVGAGVWEGTATDLLQVDGIGLQKLQKLNDAGIKYVDQLADLEFHRIERLLSRNPPFGHQLLLQVAGFPKLSLDIRIIRPLDSKISTFAADEQHTIWVTRILLRYNNDALPVWKQKTPWATFVVEGQDQRLVWFWRGSLKALQGTKELIVALAITPREQLSATFACEEITGTLIRRTLMAKRL